jgi:hypothetical protein
MKIELKHIEYSPALSEETIAFAANLYIDGVHAGFASNRGHGGSTDYYHKDERGRALIKAAEAYCQTLPPIPFPADEYMEAFEIDSNLENQIDQLLSKWLEEKENARFRKQLDKVMQQAIVFGTPDQVFRSVKFKRPIAEILRQPNGQAAIVNVLRSKVVPELWTEDLILNTNIPELLFDEAGIPPERLVIHATEAGKSTEGRQNGRGR